MEETKHGVCLGQIAKVDGLDGLGSEVLVYLYRALLHKAVLHLLGIVLLHFLLYRLVLLTFILVFFYNLDEIIPSRSNCLFKFANIERLFL